MFCGIYHRIAAHIFETQFGRTALICAAAEGHIDCVRLLVESGADAKATDNVRDMLLYTVFKVMLRVARHKVLDAI